MDGNVTVVYMDYDETMKDHISSPNYESGNARLNTLFNFKADGSPKRFCRSFVSSHSTVLCVIFDPCSCYWKAKAVELSMEVPDVLDPLDDDTTSQSTTNKHKSLRVLERFNSAAPSAIFNQQPRPRLFTIVFGRQCGGIIRWDRSGSLVTQNFDYVQHPWMLDHFLGHFTYTSATQRGHHTIANRVLATLDEHKLTRMNAEVPQTNAPRQLVRTLRALLTDPERLTSTCLDQREAGPRRSDRPVCSLVSLTCPHMNSLHTGLSLQGTWEFMSANALSNPRRSIVVEDDMESFFQLLLFCAIRYLPHNFQDVVPAFMDEYFDGSTYMKHAGQDFCGAAKLSAMTCGRIFFPNTVGCLTFYLPHGHQSKPQESSSDPMATRAATSAQNVLSSSADSSLPRLHPINAVFSRLLRWIHARYALTNEPESLPGEPVEVSAPSMGEPNVEPTEEERWFMEEYGMDDEEDEDDEEALGTDELSPEQRAAFKKLAAKLKKHKHVLNLFRRALSRSRKFGPWPRRDKVPDQLCSDSQLGG